MDIKDADIKSSI